MITITCDCCKKLCHDAKIGLELPKRLLYSVPGHASSYEPWETDFINLCGICLQGVQLDLIENLKKRGFKP